MKIWVLLLLILFLPAVVFADSLSRGDVNGLRFDKMGRYVGSRGVSVDIAYELTSSGSKRINLMGGCGNGVSKSIGSTVVSRGRGTITIKGRIPNGCYRDIHVRWGS